MDLGTHSARRWLRGAAAPLGLVVVLGACGAKPQPKAASAVRDNRMDHQACDLESSETKSVDVNGDEKVDFQEVFVKGVLVCRAADLNFDGKIDSFVYFDSKGGVTRRESDFDWNGQADEITLLDGGQVVELRRSMVAPGLIDTWHYLSGGVITRTERDANGDGIIDQWWEHPAGSADCPTIHVDLDGSGRPSLGASVNLCGDQYKPAEVLSEKEAAPVHDFRQSGTQAEVLRTEEVPEGKEQKTAAPPAETPPPPDAGKAKP